MNLSDPVWRNCNAFPDHVAVIENGRQVTYQQLYQRCSLISSRLSTAGIGRGDVVAVEVNTPLAFLLMVLAIIRIGGIVSPFTRSWPEEFKATILKRHGVKGLIRIHGDTWRSSDPAIAQYFDARSLLEPAGERDTFRPPMVEDMDDLPWFLSLSSGTTGIPKTIARTHQRELLLGMSYPEWDRADQMRVLVLLEPQTAFGLSAMLRVLINGRTLVLLDKKGPEHFFEAADRDRPTLALTSTGNAAQLVAHARRKLSDAKSRCTSLRTFAMGGSEASPPLLDGVRQYICDRYEVRYASSEAGVLAVADNETLEARPQMRAGRLMPWVTAEAVDDDGLPLPHGQPGALRFRTPFSIQGYWDGGKSFSPLLREGWFYSGDVGIVGVAGYLRLQGRIDDRINIGGNKIDPVEIEEVVGSHPAVIESVVVAVDTPGRPMPRLVAAVVVAEEPNLSVTKVWEEIRTMCKERLRPMCRPRLVRVAGLPRNPGGKVMRQQVAVELARGLVQNKEMN